MTPASKFVASDTQNFKTAPAMQSENPVHTFLAAYQLAVLAKDLEAFCSLYAEDVSVFDAWGDPWFTNGLASLRSSTKAWFDSLGWESVSVSVSDVVSTDSEDLSFGHGVFRFAGLSATGEETRWLENRFTVSLSRASGSWKVTHQHTSSPADFVSKKVQLRRGINDAYPSLKLTRYGMRCKPGLRHLEHHC